MDALAVCHGCVESDRSNCPHRSTAARPAQPGLQAQSAAKRRCLPRSAAVAAFCLRASRPERKNPLAAIAAFKHAFGRDPSACLILRCLDADAYPAGLARIKSDIAGFDNIRLYGNAGVSISSFMRAADVYLSLHRSEGFGLTMLEAMAYARPVVATNWSGNTDFMAPEGCVCVRYRLIPVHDPQETYRVPDTVWPGQT
jgi:glycosyltransferase involved in cell wall biosynthesis